MPAATHPLARPYKVYDFCSTFDRQELCLCPCADSGSRDSSQRNAKSREALDWPEEWADGAPSSSQSSSLVRRQPRRIVSGQRRGPIAVARWQAHSVGTVQRRAPSAQHPPRVSLERHGGAWNCAGESKGGLSVSRQRVVVRCVRHALLTLGCCAAQTRRGVLLGVTAPRSVLADSLAFRAPARLFRQMRQQSIERSDAGAYG